MAKPSAKIALINALRTFIPDLTWEYVNISQSSQLFRIKTPFVFTILNNFGTFHIGEHLDLSEDEIIRYIVERHENGVGQSGSTCTVYDPSKVTNTRIKAPKHILQQAPIIRL